MLLTAIPTVRTIRRLSACGIVLIALASIGLATGCDVEGLFLAAYPYDPVVYDDYGSYYDDVVVYEDVYYEDWYCDDPYYYDPYYGYDPYSYDDLDDYGDYDYGDYDYGDDGGDY